MTRRWIPISRPWLLPALLCSLFGAAACRADNPPSAAPSLTDVFLTPDTTLVNGVVPRNTTLETILRDQGLDWSTVSAAIEVTRSVFDPRRLRSSQPFLIETTREGALRLFEYEIDADSFLRVAPVGIGGTSLRAEVLPIPKTLEHARAAGMINDVSPSLYQAMAVTGESPELTLALAQIFASEIDFNTELRRGDRFALAYERYTREAGSVTYGTIEAAEFHNDDRVIRAIRFTPPGGEADYFDEDGRSLRRFFLKSPLSFEPRVTSRYSLRRLHPVLRTTQAHRGVDYGAPTGAPVVAVASGTVVSATNDRVNGRMVRLRHTNGYQTYYLHLSAFSRGIRTGVRVEQGDTIGRVGATGLATGPHLHYGMRKNGAWVDPVREHRNMPPGDPVPAAAMDEFLILRDRALEQLTGAMQASAQSAVVTATQ